MNTASRYRLLARWASGGMADVYVARQQGMAGFDKIVALKFLRDAGEHTAFRDMFLEELRVAALLNHPNIVQTFDAGEIGEHLFLAMEFVNGETLGRFARVVSRSSGAFPVELAVAISRDLANALDYAHSLTNLDGTPLGLVHRDVSPPNILLSFDGNVKLLDFGIAKVATKLKGTDAGTIKGKFSFMPPEQARGQAVDHRADIYSLGLVLWQLLTGRPAFEAKTDAELLQLVVAPDLSPPSATGARCRPELDQIVMTALSPRIEDRYASAGELATELSRYLTRYAAGFDSGKLIRALMTANFADRRERLANLVKRNEADVALEEIDNFAHQPSLRTPTPSSAKPPQPSSETAVDTTVPVGTVSSAQVPNVRTNRLPWIAAAVFAAVGGIYVLHDQLGDPEPARSTEPVRTAIVDGPQAVDEAAKADRMLATEREDKAKALEQGVAPVARSTPSAPSAPSTPSRPSVPSTPSAPVAPIVRGAPSMHPGSVVTRGSNAKVGSAGSGSAKVAQGSGSANAAQGSGSGSARIATKLDGGSAVEPIAKRPDPEPPRVTPPPPVIEVGSLDAMPAVARVAVAGSLPTSEVQSALERTTARLRECYRAAAGKAQQTPALAIKISFVIDEARAPRAVKVSGDPIGIGGCVQDAIAGIRTRSAPDVGTVSVVAQISFRPIKK